MLLAHKHRRTSFLSQVRRPPPAAPAQPDPSTSEQKFKLPRVCTRRPRSHLRSSQFSCADHVHATSLHLGMRARPLVEGAIELGRRAANTP